MADFDLNLSTRPFVAYRPLNFALVVLLIVLAGLSAWQTSGFLRYTKRAKAIRTQEQDTRVEAEVLGKRVADLEAALDRPEAAEKLTEIGFINGLIERKSFSWTKLIGILEGVVPPDVHLVSLAPEFTANGPIVLRLDVQGRTTEDVTVFLQNIEKSPYFEKVVVNSQEKKDPAAITPDKDVGITMSAIYYPEREPR